jgi:hypothetical protein
MHGKCLWLKYFARGYQISNFRIASVMAFGTKSMIKSNFVLTITEIGCRFGSGGTRTQNEVPDEIYI